MFLLLFWFLVALLDAATAVAVVVTGALTFVDLVVPECPFLLLDLNLRVDLFRLRVVDGRTGAVVGLFLDTGMEVMAIEVGVFLAAP